MCITMFCSLLYLLVLPPFPPSVFQADLLRLNGNSQTFFLTGWGGQMTELWLFSWLPSRDMRPPGSFLAGETLQTLVSGTSGMVGLPPARLRKAAWAWPEFRDFFPWISRGVHCLQLCLSRCMMAPFIQSHAAVEAGMLPFAPNSLPWSRK